VTEGEGGSGSGSGSGHHGSGSGSGHHGSGSGSGEGSGGSSGEATTYTYSLDVSSALNDTDGSESLSDVIIGNVPQGVTFSHGVVNGDGTVTVARADLDDLEMYAEESAVQSTIELTVSVSSTESANGDTATSTSTITIGGAGDDVGTVYHGTSVGGSGANVEPVFHFKLEDTSWGSSHETVTDAVNGLIGTAKGGTGSTSGTEGDAAQFDGYGDYIEVPHDASMEVATGTLSLDFVAWNNGTLASKDSTNYDDGGHFNMEVNGDREVELRIQTEDESIYLKGGDVDWQNWHNATVTWDGSNVTLYVNGEAVDSAESAWNPSANQNPWTFGASQTHSGDDTADNLRDYLDGKIDNPAMFDGALTSEQVASLYQNGTSQFIDDLPVAGSGDGGTSGGEAVTILDHDFSDGVGDFTYADNAFRGTSEGGYAEGNVRDDKIEVRLGGKDDDDITDMSGGYSKTFTVDTATSESQVSFSYRIDMDNEFESDEYAEVLISIDGQLYGTDGNDYVARLSDGGDTGWHTVTIDVGGLSEGEHTITLGGFLNKKTTDEEEVDIEFSEVAITGTTVVTEEDDDGAGSNDDAGQALSLDIDGTDIDTSNVVSTWGEAGVTLSALRVDGNGTYTSAAFSTKDINFTLDGDNTDNSNLHGDYAYSGISVGGGIDGGEIDTGDGDDDNGGEVMRLDFQTPMQQVTVKLSALFDGETQQSDDQAPFDQGYLEQARWTAYGANGEEASGVIDGTVTGLAQETISTEFPITRVELTAVDDGAGNSGHNSDFLLKGVSGVTAGSTLDSSDDYLHGGTGDDQVFGMAGDDDLRGGADDDIVVGGAGQDWIMGGTDNGQASFSESITVTFEGTNASYSNSVGYYVMDEQGRPESGEIIWSNLHQTDEGATHEILLDGFSADDLGFFIIPDGADQNSGLTDGLSVTFDQNTDGDFVAVADGVTLSGTDAPAYFSGAADLNPDGQVHIQINDDGSIGFEDLIDHKSDEDFDDAIIDMADPLTTVDAFQAGDQLWGGEQGGTGDGEHDVFFYAKGDGVDTINDFEMGTDQLFISGYDSDDLSIVQDGDDTVIRLGESGDAIKLLGVDAEAFGASSNMATYDADKDTDGMLDAEELVDMQEDVMTDGGDAPSPSDAGIVFVAPVEPGLTDSGGEEPPSV
jgi:hypothetical protein